MRLAAQRIGQGRSVAFVHGFTQTGNSWRPLLELLRTPIAACLLDAPGHGASIDASRSVLESGHDIAETMPPGVLIGYSMGARMALHAALHHHDIVRGLVLISGTPGIEDDQERAQRRIDDEALARRIETDGLESFIDSWLDLPMFKGLDRSTDQRADRLTNNAANLAASLRHAGVGTQESLWDRLPGISMPVLLIAGDEDAKFTGIARRMHGLIESSRIQVLDAVGHTAHLEDPARCAAVIDEWLSTTDQ